MAILSGNIASLMMGGKPKASRGKRPGASLIPQAMRSIAGKVSRRPSDSFMGQRKKAQKRQVGLEGMMGSLSKLTRQKPVIAVKITAAKAPSSRARKLSPMARGRKK